MHTDLVGITAHDQNGVGGFGITTGAVGPTGSGDDAASDANDEAAMRAKAQHRDAVASQHLDISTAEVYGVSARSCPVMTSFGATVACYFRSSTSS